MARADFMQMPVHAGRALIEYLHAIETDVSHAIDGIFGKYHRERNERAGVTRPAGQDRQDVQIRFAINDFLAGAFFNHLGRNPSELDQLAEQVKLIFERFRRFRLYELGDLPGDVFNIGYAES